MPRHPLSLTFKQRTAMIIGVLFLLFGGFMSWLVLMSHTQLSCDRASGECLFEKRALFSSTPETERFAIDAIKSIGLDTQQSRSSDGRTSTTHRAVLETDQQRITLSAFGSSSRGEHLHLVDGVSTFLDNPDQQTLQLEHRPSGLLGMLVLLFPAIGLLVLFGMRTVAEIEVQPGTGLLVLRQRRWWQSSGKEQRLQLADIQEVEVETSRGSGRRNTITHQAVIRMKSGDSHPLFSFSSSGNGAFKRAEQLRELLERARQTHN